MEIYLAQIIDGDPVPTFVIDAKHHITHWNQACSGISGVPASEVVGTNLQWQTFYETARPTLADLIVNGSIEEQFDTYYHGLFKRSSSVAGAYEAESYFPKLGQNGRWLFFTAAPLRDTDGNLVGAIETLQDISAQRRADQAQQQLLQSEKMAAIGQLAAGVAHEINNPVGFVNSNLGSLKTYVGHLLDVISAYENGDPAQIAQARQSADIEFLREDLPSLLSESQEGLSRVTKIVQDLKDFSHVDHTGHQQANLNAAMESTLNVVWNEIKYKAEVIRQFGDIPLVDCIPAQINQVFMNLLVNAAQAIPERGKIIVRSGLENNHVWFEIEDTGKGMSAEIQQRIFEPFFTTKPVGQGTGLGLSISYDIIVKKHSGRMDVRSKPDQGTCFRLWLPLQT